MKATVTRTVDVAKTPRVMQMAGLFDVPLEAKSTVSWDVHLPIEDRDWSIGAIIGPSGCGKTTIARELFGDAVVSGFDWPADRSILDGFPADLSVKDVVGLLTRVGFGSAPNWCRPFHVLSNGEQFRATVARALAEMPDLAVIDEFTSVVDRQVARVAAASVAKAVRRGGRKFVAVTCHFDVTDWLQPDWVYEPATGDFEWRSVRRRPGVDLEIRTAGKDLWPQFSQYHYLSPTLHTAAVCFAAFADGRPVAFNAIRRFVHPKAKDIMLGHRLVVHPDWQGLGIGCWFDDWLGEWLWDRGWRYVNVVAHPAMVNFYKGSPRWKLRRSGFQHGAGGTKKSIASIAKHQRAFSLQRASHSFEYLPADGRGRPRTPANLRAEVYGP